MNCPHCRSTAITKRTCRTALGYRRFNCRSCGRRFNKRTGTPLNDPQYPTDIVLLAVLWRLRYKLSFRDVAEMLLSAASRSLTRPSANGSSASLRCSPTGFAPSVGAVPASPGTSTRHT